MSLLSTVRVFFRVSITCHRVNSLCLVPHNLHRVLGPLPGRVRGAGGSLTPLGAADELNIGNVKHLCVSAGRHERECQGRDEGCRGVLHSAMGRRGPAA